MRTFNEGIRGKPNTTWQFNRPLVESLRHVGSRKLSEILQPTANVDANN